MRENTATQTGRFDRVATHSIRIIILVRLLSMLCLLGTLRLLGWQVQMLQMPCMLHLLGTLRLLGRHAQVLPQQRVHFLRLVLQPGKKGWLVLQRESIAFALLRQQRFGFLRSVLQPGTGRETGVSSSCELPKQFVGCLCQLPTQLWVACVSCPHSCG